MIQKEVQEIREGQKPQEGQSDVRNAQSGTARELTCICCPVGCQLKVVSDKTGQVTVTGNTCKRGEDYGRKELTNPTRTVTSTVRVRDRQDMVVAVKTAEDIPKGKMKECMEALAGVRVELPVKVGDIVLEDVAGTGVKVVVTRGASAL